MKEQIEVAAKWWADQFRHGTKQDNGDGMTTILATVIGSRIETASKADAFEAALKELLPDHLLRCWTPEDPSCGSSLRCLSCDYGPCQLLQEAAHRAGIDPFCPPFPMKTVMWINPDSVRVKHGYGAPDQVLWTKLEATQ